MEKILDVYEHDISHGRSSWRLKNHIYKEFENEIIDKDIIYFEYYNPKYSLKKIDEYLASINCTRTRDKNLADKIVWYGIWGRQCHVPKYTSVEPTELSEEVINRHKYITWLNLETSIAKFFDSKRQRIEFDYDQYETLWDLYLTDSRDNWRLAGMSIMTIDWTDNMFLLHFLICQFQYRIRDSNYSNIPDWSNWANTIGISWKYHNVDANQLVALFKNYEITPEQIKLIHKLLNK